MELVPKTQRQEFPGTCSGVKTHTHIIRENSFRFSQCQHADAGTGVDSAAGIPSRDVASLVQVDWTTSSAPTPYGGSPRIVTRIPAVDPLFVALIWRTEF